ncbi:MAG: TetR/AcrR family transcriptional regulator [Bacteroidota bacterium]
MGITERKEREKQQRREGIIQAAEKVFFSKGFDHSTMDDIADEAELSKGTLYLYFKSKDVLHMEVAKKAIILLNTCTSRAADKGTNALEKLRQMGRATIDFFRTYPDHMKAIIALTGIESGRLGLTTTDVQGILYDVSSVGMVLELVEQGVKDKLIRSDIPPVLIAHTLWMQLMSVIQFVSVEESLFDLLELSPDKVYESHFELVLNGIKS